jgi:hypothetical protein
LLGAFAVIGCASKVVLHVRNDAAAEGGTNSSGGVSSGSGGSAGTITGSGGQSGSGQTGGSAGTSSGGAGVGGGACAATSGGNGWFFDTGTEGFTAYGTAGTDLSWASGGCPDGGSVELSIQFSGPDQEAAASITIAPTNLSAARAYTAWVKMPSGVPEGVTALFFKDATSAYASGPTVAVYPGADWVELRGDLTDANAYVTPGFDATRITEIGVQVNTPPNTPSAPRTTTVFIDSLAQ